MARKRAQGDQYAAFFETELAVQERVLGRRSVLVDGADRARKYGIEIPSLALQYVVANNVLFMEMMTLLAGKQASHKSSMAFEIARWVLAAGGFARLFDTEGHYSPKLAESLLGNLANERSWRVLNCQTLNQWIESVVRLVDTYRDAFAMDRKLGRGEKRMPLLPVCVIIDSLTGKATDANIEALQKDGQSQNVQGMQIARDVTNFLQSLDLVYLPWYFVIIRHQKKSTTQGILRGPQDHTPGSVAMDFHGGLDLRLSIAERRREDAWGYNYVLFRCRKNAFGPDSRQCGVRFSWDFVSNPDTKQAVQVPRWEWDLATAEFLADCGVKEVSEICNVERISGTKSSREPRFDCTALGLRGVSGRELGMAVRTNAEMTQALQAALNITRWPVFDPGAVLPESFDE